MKKSNFLIHALIIAFLLSASGCGGGGGGAGTWFNSIRGGAASLMKNVKDASSKVVETVSA